MPEELIQTLIRFHREFIVPDVERIVQREVGAVRDEMGAMRNEMLSHLDAIYKRFDRLESEYQALSAQVARLEKWTKETDVRLASIESKLDVRSEIDELKARVVDLQKRIELLEAEL